MENRRFISPVISHDKDRNQIIIRMNQPVFLHAVRFIQCPFFDVVFGGSERGQHFDNEIRRTETALVVNFLRIADYRNIRLNRIGDVMIMLFYCFGQSYIKRRKKKLCIYLYLSENF